MITYMYVCEFLPPNLELILRQRLDIVEGCGFSAFLSRTHCVHTPTMFSPTLFTSSVIKKSVVAITITLVTLPLAITYYTNENYNYLLWKDYSNAISTKCCLCKFILRA